MMKKVFLLMVVAVLGMATANAQWYLGGSLGFRSSTDDPDMEGFEKGKVTAFSIIPEVGYSLTEKLDLGIAVGFSTSKFENTTANFIFMGETMSEDVTDLKVTGWQVIPYVRYNLVQFGRFSVLGKAELGIAGNQLKNKISGTSYESKFTSFGINIKPVMKYELSSKFNLFADLNFLALGFNRINVKDGGNYTEFGLNIDTDNILNLGGGTTPFVIGFNYCF